MGRVAIKAAAVALLNTVDNVGVVHDRTGAKPAWAEYGGPVPHWEVTVTEGEIVQVGMQGYVDRPYFLRVEGWYPHDFDGDSASRWDVLLDAVTDTLLDNHRTLSGTWVDAFPPETVAEDEVMRGDGTAELLCHHVIIQIRGKDEIVYG